MPKFFYKEPLKMLSSFEIFQPHMFKDIMNGLKFKRFFDEENNLCPYSIDLITQSDISTFKKCTESLIELLRDIDVNQYGTYENLSFTSGYCFYYESFHFRFVIFLILKI
ncbi:hypothetical protein H8356DRAFT_1418423 [Neocallimastix lanati (nom. inval.)]|nr:hypothetical protein H8356DRAFT_1418423 [Neocallimastix sp. JGI-2020a]